MGLAWQQGPLAPGAIGQFLLPEALPERLLYAEPLRRRIRVRFHESWLVDSEDVILLHEPGRYPVAYFRIEDVTPKALVPSSHATFHRDLGATAWYTVRAGDQSADRAAWQHTNLPAHAEVLEGRLAFSWRAMDAFYEEDERIVGHAADNYHRIDIRQSSRRLTVRRGDRMVADTSRALVLYESGFAPRWYVPRDDVDESALRPVEGRTFCPYKGLCSYYDIGDDARAVWSYEDAWQEVARISNYLSFEPDRVTVQIDGKELRLEPGQTVISHGADRNLSVDELAPRQQPEGMGKVREQAAPGDVGAAVSSVRVAATPDLGPLPAIAVVQTANEAKVPPRAVIAAIKALWVACRKRLRGRPTEERRNHLGD
jgi:uncharacterized protein (DUF427 family)